MKFLYTLPVLALLSACADPVPCMKENEKGTVVRSTTDVREFCGRGGCTKETYSYVNISVNGVSRTCVVPRSTADMFAPGEVINLSTGERL